jgi:alpha-glucosidase
MKNWLGYCFLLGVLSLQPATQTDVKDWWEKTIFYQIYPRSFMDANDDGIGDLKGVESKLAYLKETGIDAVWLSPIFESPMVDFGYDISDYRKIQPEYGTMEDFDNMIAEAKRLDIKIILDFVPNHSSDKCEWFIKSAAREPGYEDYYVWHDGKPDPAGGPALPPNNWVGFKSIPRGLNFNFLHLLSNQCSMARRGLSILFASSSTCTNSPSSSRTSTSGTPKWWKR